MIEKGETKLFSFSMADYKCPEKGPNLRIARAKWEDNIDVTSEEKLQRFLEIHMMRDDGYYGYYPVSNRPYCNGRPLNMRSIGFINTENVVGSVKILGDLTQKGDYYITANAFKIPKSRRANNVHSLTNIVMDIDVHTRGGIRGCRDVIIQRLDALLYHIFVSNPDSLNIPCPNTVVHTGRGIQLWWAIKPLSAKKLKYVYKGVQEHLYETLEKKIYASDPEFKEFVKIDYAASKKVAGLFRMPGTYNTKSKKYGNYFILHEDKLDAIELYFTLHPATGKPYVKYKKKKKKKGNAAFRKNNYGNHIENMIRSLIELRRSAGEQEDGYRDLYCVITLSAYLSNGASEEEAWKHVVELNNSFRSPLSMKELRGYMSTALYKKYKYRNETIIKYLQIDESEQKALGFYAASVYYEERQKAKQRGEERKKAKEIRETKIIELFTKGHLQDKIAELVGCAQSTVSKVLKAAGITRKSKKNGIKKAAKALCQRVKRKKTEKQELTTDEKLKQLAAEDPKFAKTMQRLAELKAGREKYKQTKEEFARRKPDERFRLMSSEEDYQEVIRKNCAEYEGV